MSLDRRKNGWTGVFECAEDDAAIRLKNESKVAEVWLRKRDGNGTRGCAAPMRPLGPQIKLD